MLASYESNILGIAITADIAGVYPLISFHTFYVVVRRNGSRRLTCVTGSVAVVVVGVVAGGGVALLNTAVAVRSYADTLDEDQRTGALILLKALEAPVRQIAQNSGLDGSVVVGKLMESAPGTGYDAESGEYVNMIQAGILDPVKVTRLALENAVSVASTLLTSEVCVVDSDKN